jgi:hypothetical protein
VKATIHVLLASALATACVAHAQPNLEDSDYDEQMLCRLVIFSHEVYRLEMAR